MPSTLSPGFLVASPALKDPNFDRTVIVLVEHSDDGSLGFVVNRPAPVTFAEVADLLKLEFGEGAEGTPVHFGGPVAPQSGWILFDPRGVEPDMLGEAVSVSERLAVSASRRLLATIARGEGPGTCLLALGYAGWGPGQLDREFTRGVWIPVDLHEPLVFETAPEERWSEALTRAGIDPARMSGTAFSA
ncbi:MAG: YqgE/AlgH family protein [Sandaracinaceae bacterium]